MRFSCAEQKVVYFICGCLGLVVLLQNTQVTSFQFLFWRLSMSRVLLFLLIFAAGLGAGFWMGKKRG